MTGYYDYLCCLLEPMRIYRTERGSISGSELYAAGCALDEVQRALAHAEREGLLPLAENEGIARRERLFARCPVNVSPELRRAAVAALERIGGDGFTLEEINAALCGCGIRALAEETARRGVIRVRFPDTVGVPEEFAQVESIILDIIPCHLLTEFCFRYLTWAECELQGFTWRSAEAAQHSWESFEKAVPEQ